MSVRHKMSTIGRGCRKWVYLILGILILVAIILTGFSLMRKPNLESVGDVTAAVARHVIVPDEVPILATITDKSALKTAFLKKAENDDKILIYEKARIVIIYRPSVDRIVTIGPVTLDNLPTTK